jgi:PPM family protein phosphatase
MSDRAQSHASAEAARFPVRAAVVSDTGLVRRENQDCAAALTSQGIFVVCDGMGGAAAGKLASELAVQAFVDHLVAPGAEGDGIGEGPPLGAFAARRRLEQAIAAANDAVFTRAQRQASLHGMGTTLVAAILTFHSEENQSAWIGHVGDSRCYLYRDSRLLQLTRDHSVVQEQIEAGLLDSEEAEFSPIRNVITRAVGTQAEVPADLAEHALVPGDLLLLASDGLTRELTDGEIAAVLAAGYSDLHLASQRLVDTAIQRGGNDNITVLLVAPGGHVSATPS